MKMVEIAIDRHGQVNIDVVGVQGAQCEEIVAPIVDGLGEKAEGEKKRSYYQETHVREHEHVDIDSRQGGG